VPAVQLFVPVDAAVSTDSVASILPGLPTGAYQ